jgi:hypothetical protein
MGRPMDTGGFPEEHGADNWTGEYRSEMQT